MPNSSKTRLELESKERQTSEKIETLTDLKQKYFNEGFTAAKERQRYLALKIIEIEQELRGLANNLKTISTKQAGLDALDTVGGRKGTTSSKPVRQGPGPVSKGDMDRLYKEWEEGKTKTRQSVSAKKVVTKAAVPEQSYKMFADANKTVSHQQMASIKPLIASSSPDENANRFLNFQAAPQEDTDPSILNPFSTTSMNDINVTVQYVKKINMALVHNNSPIIDRISITNTSSRDIGNIMAGVWVSPDYSESFETSISTISPLTTKEIENITPPFSTGRLKNIHETEKGTLRLELTDGYRKIFTESYPIELMAYNEWYIGSEYKFAETIASFIFSNDSPDEAVIEPIISHAVKRLESICGSNSFDGYQSKDPKKVFAQARAVFEAIQQDIGLTYINPPASFEFTGQKILSPKQIMEHKRGTCLDTTVLYAACLERIGLHPVVFMVQGHAFAGFWLVDDSGLYIGNQRAAKVPVYDAVRDVVEKMYLVPVETTLMTDRRSGFENAVGAWVQGNGDRMEFRLPGEGFHCMVDVWGCRLSGIRPMPV